MICAKCGSLIDDRHISCMACAARKSGEALHKAQQEPLRQAAAGKLMLHMRAIHGVRHVQLFGDDRTWCNLPVEPGHRTWSAYYHDLEGPKLCAACLTLLRIALEEATAK